MHVRKIIIAFLCSLSVTLSHAAKHIPVEFFASNNTQEISLQTAYLRLTGKEQAHLQRNMIKIMQKNHMEQGVLKHILGTYRMAGTNHITADNTEHFSTSSYQHIPQKKIFSLAKTLAIQLKQESVAVLIPDKSMTAGIKVRFISEKPDINKVVNLLQEKLPDLYSQAFSLHLINTCNDFNKAQVAQVEWLGSKINPHLVKEAFPLEKIKVRYGKVYLVYQDGQKEQL